jgi:hypothetical protein
MLRLYIRTRGGFQTRVESEKEARRGFIEKRLRFEGNHPLCE